MKKTVEELQSLSLHELAYWEAKFQVDPFGSWRENYHAGLIASQIYNAHRGKADTVSPLDFILKTEGQAQDDESRRAVDWLLAMSKPEDK